MDEKIYLIDLMNLSNHLHILNYGEFDIIKIGIINTSRNLQMFSPVFFNLPLIILSITI